MARQRELSDTRSQCADNRPRKGFAGITDEIALAQVVTLDENCKKFGVEQFEINDPRQGIVHVVGPEQGATCQV